MEQHHYTIVVEPDTTGWLAYVPALPGCHASGESPEEAIRELDIVFVMIQEEYEEEGRPLPPDVAVAPLASSS